MAAVQNKARENSKEAIVRAKPVVELTERQAKILAAIVKEYSNQAQPVGSEDLNNRYNFNVSPATIRNEMMALEKLGYIEQPHTSAGRVPTDKGYRYFVNQLMHRFELSLKEQKLLQAQVNALQAQHQELGKNISKLLAQITDQAAFTLLPDEVSATGLANILQDSNLDKTGIIEVVQFFENIDEFADKMLTKFFADKPEALIGAEHHLPHISNYSLVISKIHLPSGKNGLIGIIGPKSMRYDKNMTVVEFVAKYLSVGSSAAMVLLLAY